MSIESVAEELRVLQRRIDAQRANAHTWPTKEEELAADLDRYDRRLLKAAAMLRVEAPTGPGREEFLLGEDDRRQLQERLVEAGLDVGTGADKGSQS
ncbi:MAG TPA: hypothetical protein VHF27_10495 [Acidimicrobiales bacterium]|nr:hypothetical protein [Acidimicrobiales bacterium]